MFRIIIVFIILASSVFAADEDSIRAAMRKDAAEADRITWDAIIEEAFYETDQIVLGELKADILSLEYLMNDKIFRDIYNWHRVQELSWEWRDPGSAAIMNVICPGYGEAYVNSSWKGEPLWTCMWGNAFTWFAIKGMQTYTSEHNDWGVTGCLALWIVSRIVLADRGFEAAMESNIKLRWRLSLNAP